MRLTTTDINGNIVLNDTSESGMSEALKKLAKYESAEESGDLLYLPCKVGTFVWYVDDYFGLSDTKVVCGLVEGYWWTNNGFALDIVWEEPIMGARYKRRYMELYKVGKSVFLNKEDAIITQQKLAKNNE